MGAVVCAAALVTGGVLLVPRWLDANGNGDEDGRSEAAVSAPSATARGRSPRTGEPVEVDTADGSAYRIAAVTGGTGDGLTTLQTSPPTGGTFAYIEYVLTNPSKQRALLDFPGDVFVRRTLVSASARGRCMWQAGVPESMCTPPTKSEVVRRLSGDALVGGEGGDKYLPPGSSYLVRATVQVPVDRRLKKSDLRLYIWQPRYMAGRQAEAAPFPGSG